MRKKESRRECGLTLGLSFCLFLYLMGAMSLPMSKAAPKSFSITVAAGSADRRDAIVSFTLPVELTGKSYGLREASGRLLPLQIDAERRATFVLSEMKAGAKKDFVLETVKPDAASAAQGIQLAKEGDRLKITAAGRRVLEYLGGPGELPRPEIKPIFRRGGYIHPVYTPSGRIITGDYPPDHIHHHGVWFAWTKTEFEGRHPDFWNMGDGTGRVEFVALDETWSGAVQSGFRARHRYVDLSAPTPKTVLNEVWEVMVYRGGQGAKAYSMFDLVSTQECATSSPLVLPEYRYGGVAFRGPSHWLGKDNATFLTSEGKGRDDGNATNARWCHIGGQVDGQLVGIAVLCHPGNFRAPQPLRIHPNEPYFNFAPSVAGQWEIAPGKPYISKYRYVVYDGPPDVAELNRLWNDYANPPQVTIKAK